MKQAMTAILSILFFFIFLSLWGFYFAIRPVKITSSVTPSDYGISYESVSFRTQDNVLIQAWFIPSSIPHAKTIILLHGYPADKGDILPSRIFLHPYYNLLLFDFRYLGQSGGHFSTAGKNEVLDLQAALQYLASRGIHEVGVWGFSLGGSVALMTAPQAPQIKAMVVESAYARLDWMANEYYRLPVLKYVLAELTRFWAWLFLHFDIKDVAPIKSAEKLTIPILLIYSQQDNVVPFEHAILMQNTLSHRQNYKFIIVEEALHGETIKDYQKIIKQFFDANL